MKKIGFFGGSFNPPTLAHFEIVKSALKEGNLDKIVIVPMGDKYQKAGLIPFEDRYNMISKMFENEPKVEISRMQANQQEVSYAIDSFEIIDKEYKNDERYFIMGLDNFSRIDTWKSNEKLVLNRKFIIFQRENYNVKNNFSETNVKFINVKNSTSSSLVRQKIKDKEDIENLLSESVKEYIDQKGLYQ